MRLLRNTKTSPQYGFARSASLTSADSVCTDLRKSTGCAASTTLRSSSPRAAPLRRAASEMFAPSSKLFATIRAFSSPVHRRRRRCLVITSRGAGILGMRRPELRQTRKPGY